MDDICRKDLRFLNQVRRKYASAPIAYDAIVYHALHSKEPGVDLSTKLRLAIQYYASPDGEARYQDVVAALEEPPLPKEEEEEEEEGREIYEYSHELAKAAKHKEGLLSLEPGALPPEYFAVESLSKFKKTI